MSSAKIENNHHQYDAADVETVNADSIPTSPPPKTGSTETAFDCPTTAPPALPPPPLNDCNSAAALLPSHHSESTPPTTPGSAQVNHKTKKGKFTVQFTSKSTIQKRDVATPPSPPSGLQVPVEQGDETNFGDNNFERALSGSFGKNASSTRNRRGSSRRPQPYRPILSFRPDLNEEEQKHRVRRYKNLISSARLLEDAKTANFVVVTSMENHVTSLKDMKWRLKALVAESFTFHQTLLQRMNNKEEQLLLKKKMSNDQSPPPVGSQLFTELLIDDVDVMFQHCMHTMTKRGDVASLAEGAVLAFRHSSEQLNKIKLWVE